VNIFLAILFLLVLLIPLWALFGSSEEERASGAAAPDAPRRRAADRIQKELEDEVQSKGPRRRRSDEDSDGHVSVGEDFALPHPARDIVPEQSPFAVYSRALENVENYITKGDFDTALSLYEGIQNRISDDSIRDKIEENMDYLNNYEQVAASRAEELKQKKRKQEEQEIRLSLAGGSLNEKIQISMAPAEIDIDSLADRVRHRLGEKAVTPENAELEHLRNELRTLRTELAHIEKEKEHLKEERSTELSGKLDEMQEFAQTLRDISSSVSRDSELEALKTELASIKAESRPRDSVNDPKQRAEGLTDEIVSLQNQLDEVRREREQARAIDERIMDLLSRQNEITSRQDSSSRHEARADKLNDELDALRQSVNDLAARVNPDTPATDSAAAGSNSPVGGTGSPGAAGSTELKMPGQTKPEDTRDEFETLSDLLSGPKYDAPSDDEIMEEILKSAAKDARKEAESRQKADLDEPKKDDKEEYEVRGPKGEVERDIDLDRILFAAPPPVRHEDEQFYTSFMDRYAPKRKELPILRVSYSFDKLPERNTLSREQNVLEFSFYKYKPLIEKANDYIKRRRVKDALNYYKVILDQNIPEEFKSMIRQNVDDLNEYLQKYMNS
jgi:hypothetical protein